MTAEESIKEAIRAADRAITREDFETLMDCYTDDAMLVVKAGTIARGKAEIRQAFVHIAEHFRHGLVVEQGHMQVLLGGDTALVVMETKLTIQGGAAPERITRRATYVYRHVGGRWLCAIDNSYGTDLLDARGRG